MCLESVPVFQKTVLEALKGFLATLSLKALVCITKFIVVTGGLIFSLQPRFCWRPQEANGQETEEANS